MLNRWMFLLGMLVVTAISGPAFAYVGPGAGLSLLGTLWGLAIAVFAALSFLIAWPIRRMLRQRRSPRRRPHEG